MSAFQVVRVTGVSHGHLADKFSIIFHPPPYMLVFDFSTKVEHIF
jgi:hypothetical protein